MIERYLPYAADDTHDPIIRYGVRRVRWGRTPRELARYTLVVTGVVLLIAAALWGLTVALQFPARNACFTQSGYGCHWQVLGASSQFLAVLALASVGMDILLDFACVIAAVNSLGLQVGTGYWDLLRLTPLREEAIIASRHALAQVRAWRMMVVVLAARVALVALVLADAVLQRALTPPSPYNAYPGLFLDLLLYAGLVIVAAVYLVEPYWRMRAVTALGMALSARFRGVVPTTLAALGALLALWIVQALVMGFLSYGALLLAFVLSYLVPVCASGFTGFIIYVFYRSLQHSGLARAVRYSFWGG